MNSMASAFVWQDVFLRAFLLHWVFAIAVVTLVAVFIAANRRLNATTRHALWFITLLGVAVMPFMIFVPKPNVDIGVLSLFTLPQAVATSGPDALEYRELASPANADSIPESAVTRLEYIAVKKDQASASTAVHTTPVSGFGAAGQINIAQIVSGILIFWLAGVMYLLRRLWREYRAARELELQSDSVSPYFERRFTHLCQRLKVKKAPLLRFHAGIHAPMTVGLGRVWIAIPMIWKEQVDDDIFDQTLTHELGHIARKDPLINTLQRIMSMVLWPYPAIWYVTRQMEVERESACDDWVLIHDGKGHTYATNLLDVAESLYLQPHVLAVGCLRSHSQLSRRIQNLLDKSSDHAVRNSWLYLGTLSAGLFITLSVSAVMWPDVRILNSSSPQVNAVLQPADKVADVQSQLHVTSQFAEQIAAKKPPSNVASQPAKHIVATHQPLRATAMVNGIEIDATKHPVLNAAWSNNFLDLKRGIYRDKEDINRVYPRASVPRTVLEAAILRGHKEMVEALIGMGVELNMHTWAGGGDHALLSPLTVSAMVGATDIAQLLIKHGARTDDQTFRIAVQKRHSEFVRMLLNEGQSLDGDVLALAVNNRDDKMVHTLLKYRKCDCLDFDSALMIAVQNRDQKFVNLMLKHDAKIDEKVLMLAAQNGEVNLIRSLVRKFDRGIDKKVLLEAMESNERAVITELLTAGNSTQEQKRLTDLPDRHYGANRSANTGNKSAEYRKNHPYKSAQEHIADFPLSGWPVNATGISLAFEDSAKQFTGNDTQHQAIDFLAPVGSDVIAAAAGVVVSARFNEDYGHYVLIDHGNHYVTKYANNEKNIVVKGDRVRKGDKIAVVGSSADISKDAHLHFEVKHNNIKIDPEKLFVSER